MYVIYIERKIVCTRKNFETNTESYIKLKKINRIKKFNKKAWWKLYIDLNTRLD